MKGNRMLIRPARPGDEPKILAIMEATDLLPAGVDHSTWTGLLLVAERQGEVVGFAHCLPGRPYAVLTQMGVLPAHQKGRAAVKLLEAVELMLRGMGCTYWVCYVNETNKKAIDPLEGYGAVHNGFIGYQYGRSLT